MKWSARLRFKACRSRQVRQKLDSAGKAVGEPLATPYCPERFLTLVYIKDDEGREFQIGTIGLNTAIQPLEMKVVDPGYKVLADKAWRTTL